MTSLDSFAKTNLEKISEKSQLRELKNIYQIDSRFAFVDGKKMLSFAHNDYFGLSCHKAIKKAAIKTIKKYGVGGKSARLLSANYPEFQEFEENLAKYKNTKKALIFSSGYLTAIGVIPALMDKKDIIIADKLIHSSLLDAIKLSGAKLIRFKHNDMEDLEQILKKERNNFQNSLIITETIFSMDGDLGDIENIIKLSKKHNSWMLSDDAHGIGLVKNLSSPNHIQLGTLSKGLGSFGGYICASKKICDLITTKAKSFIYTTAISPSLIASANEALNIIKTKNPQKKLLENIKYLSKKLNSKNRTSPIFIIEYKSITELNQAHKNLLKNNIYVSKIRPPTSKTPRLRISLSSSHTKKDLEKLAKLTRVNT